MAYNWASRNVVTFAQNYFGKNIIRVFIFVGCDNHFIIGYW
jgi:hypothetical protein